MVWSKRLVLLVVPLFLTLNAFGQKIQFGAGERAELNAYPTLSKDRTGVSPVEIRLTIPTVDLQNATDGFQKITVPGLNRSQDFGSPEVMETGSLIAVPAGYEPVLTVLSQNQEEVRDVLLQPCQEKFRCATTNDSFSFNSAIYQSRGVYPSQVASLEELGYLQSVRLVRVALNPVQQNFGRNSLQVTTDLHVRVDFKAVGRSEVAVLPRSIASVVMASTVNGASLVDSIRVAPSAEIVLVFVADSLKATVAPYAQWKQQQGYDVRVVTFTEAGGTKEATKEYIQKFYDSNMVKPTALLFVGNKTTMPTFTQPTGSGAANSDYTYALLAGGATDPIPDVTYGRLAANTEAEVATQINRWIAYEKSATPGMWYPQAMTIASNEGSNPSDKEYAQQIQAALKVGTYKKFDNFFQGDGIATPANITAALSEGRTWISYFGHGSGTSWGSTNGSFNVGSVDALTNPGKLPVVIDVACMNGNWVGIDRPFGKAWVTAEKEGQATGAVAFYGGSVNISWDPPAIMSVGVAKSHFEKGVNILGANLLAGQLYLYTNTSAKAGTTAQKVDNIEWYNLLGDPALSMRTDSPAPIRVKVIKTGEREVSLKITATDENGKALANLTASVSKEQKAPLSVAKTDMNGQAVLSLGTVGSLQGALLTVGGYNTVVHQEALK